MFNGISIRRTLPAALAVAAFGLVASPLSAQTTGATPANAAAHSHGDSADVVATVERFHAALTAGDSAGAMALLAPDAIILESGGVETREEYRSHHLPGDMAYAKSMKSTRKPIRVTVRGDVAWASSTSTTTGESRGRAVNSAGAELVVLARTAAGWRISAIHWSSRTIRPPA